MPITPALGKWWQKFKVILGPLEAENQPGLRETLSKQQQNPPKAGGVTQKNKTTLTMFKALGLIPSTSTFRPNILSTNFYTLDKTGQASLLSSVRL